MRAAEPREVHDGAVAANAKIPRSAGKSMMVS
jgi:hypothetical protein